MKNIRFICAVSFVLLFIGLTEVQAKDESFCLENDYVSLRFNPETFGLTSMFDKVTGTEHVYNDSKNATIWQLDFKRGSYSTNLTNTIVKPVVKHELLSDGSQLLSLTWDNIHWWRDDNFATVHVAINLPKDSGIALWRINVNTHDDLWGLWGVKFPYVKGFLKSGQYDVAIPDGNGGSNYKNLAWTITRKYPSGPWPAQFLCGTKDNSSFYMSAMDPDSRVKEFYINPGDEFYINLFPEEMGAPGSNNPDKFSYAFGVYQGNWEKACKIYRNWALEQRWTARGPLSQRDDVPKVIKNTGIWLRSNGYSKEVVSDIEDTAAKLEVPLGVHWYDWNIYPFDNYYPYYFPGQPGIKETFKNLTEKGVLVMPYINGMIADYGNTDIENYLPHATIDEYGLPRINIWGKASGRMLIMCPTQKFWQDKILSVIDTLYHEYGVNGVYIDQVTAHPAELCFDKSHGHPIGGGSHWVDGYREMMSKIKDYASPRGMAITSEDPAEPYMDQIDASLTWQMMTEEQVPMMQMVYSGYTLYFGSITRDTNDGIFNSLQGRAFLWGHQNGWISPFYLKEGHEKKAEFMKKISKYRVATRHFLTYGELLELIKPTNDVPVVKTSIELYGNTRRFEYPEVMGSVWKSEDGKIGVYMVNSSANENKIDFMLDLKDYASAGKYKLYQVDERGKRKFIERVNLPNHTFSEIIESTGIKVLELDPL